MIGLKVTARQKLKKTRRLEIPEIIAFYTRDDVSKITSGKKECRVKINRRSKLDTRNTEQRDGIIA